MFPRARYHVQDKEMHFCTGRCMCHKQLRNSYEEDYVVSMLRKVYAGRVTFHDGVSEMAPGITLHHIGGHAMGLQSIRVKTRRGFVMLAADAVHLFPHLDEARVFPTTYNLGEVLEGYETLKRLATSRNHIVPGHDPAVMKIYPAASPSTGGPGDPPRRRSEGVIDGLQLPSDLILRDSATRLLRMRSGGAAAATLAPFP